MQTVNPSIVNKFFGLLTSLTHTKTEFELVADEIEECNLKTALNGLSMESSQYINELSMQLKTLGIEYQSPSVLYQLDGANNMSNEIDNKNNGDEIMYICRNNEDFITNAYREILNESFPFANLKEIMRFQLNALKYAFMKIKFLNSARFVN